MIRFTPRRAALLLGFVAGLNLANSGCGGGESPDVPEDEDKNPCDGYTWDKEQAALVCIEANNPPTCDGLGGNQNCCEQNEGRHCSSGALVTHTVNGGKECKHGCTKCECGTGLGGGNNPIPDPIEIMPSPWAN